MRQFVEYLAAWAILMSLCGVVVVVNTQTLSNNYIIKTLSSKNNGDGFSTTFADISTPTGMVVTSSGMTILIDRGNSKLRQVNGATGVISTIDSNLKNPTGISLNSKNGMVYYSDTGHHVIKKLDLSTMSISVIAGQMDKSGNTTSGPAVSALLNLPTGLFVNQDNEIFFSDSGNFQLKKITSDGQLELLAGTGALGMSIDGTNATKAMLLMTPSMGSNTISQHPISKELYFVDNFFIRKLVNGSIFTVGGGKAVGPGSFVFNSTGGIIMTQYVGHKLSNMDSRSGVLSDLAGTGYSGSSGISTTAANETMFNFPSGLFVMDSGEILVSDTRNNKLSKYSNGKVFHFAGSGTPSYFGSVVDVKNAIFSNRIHMFYHAQSGDVYVADQFNHRIRKVSNNGIVTNVAGSGIPGDSVGEALSSMLNSPQGVYVNSLGEIFIADSGNHKIKKVNTTGHMSVFAGSNKYSFDNLGDNGLATSSILRDPCCVYGNSKGDIFIGDTSNYRLRKVNGTSGIITTVSGGGNSYNDVSVASQALLMTISSLYVNTNDEVVFSDTFKIRKIDTNGNLILLAGNGQNNAATEGAVASTSSLLYPKSAIQVPTGETLFIEQHALRMITKDGKIKTIAGSVSECGLSGENSLSNSSLLCYPTSFVISKEGGLLIYQNNYLRSLLPPTCYGIDSRDAKVCNGGGSCQFTDTCSCYAGYSGASCSVISQPPATSSVKNSTTVVSGSSSSMLYCFHLLFVVVLFYGFST